MIPEGLATLYGYTFSGCYALTDATLPSTVIKIGDGVFENCPSLIRVNIKALQAPDIGLDAFRNNHANRKFYVPTDAVANWKANTKWVEAGYSGAVNPMN